MSSEVPAGWRFEQFGDLTSETLDRNNGRYGREHLFGVSNVSGLEPMRARVMGRSTERCRVVRDHDFAYNPMRLNVGSIAQWNGEAPIMVSPDYVTFAVETSRADPTFVRFLTESRPWTSQVAEHGTGSVRVRLYYRDIARFRFPVPPLPEQKKIAAILTSVDEGIQATQAVIEQTRRVKEGLLQDLLIKGIGHTRFKQTKIGEIPEAWECQQLGTIAEVRSGVAKNSNRTLTDPMEVAYLRVANVQDGYLDLHDIKTLEIERTELERYALHPGDVLMNEGGDIDKLGRGDVWEGQIDPCVHQNHVFSVRCGPRLRPRYLSYLAESPYGKAYFLAKGKQTTNLASINKTQLSALPVPLPPVEEQDVLVAHLGSLRGVTDTAEREVSRLKAIKAGLLQDLLTGKVRVSV